MSDFSKTIFRTVKRENPYAQIDKTVLNDKRLSWKAKGLLAFLLSKPDNWEINIKNLIKQAKDGKEAIYSGIKELITFGYIVRVESRNKGRFAQIEYLIYENPQLVNTKKLTDFPEEFASIQQNTIKTPLPGNPDTVNPYPAKPEPAFPETENPPPINNDLLVRNDLTKDPPTDSPKKLQEAGGDKPDLLILEPVAVKLFGQANQEILENLWSKIKEFKLDPEVVQESLNQIDAKAIKYNPYGYFKGIYSIATAIITKRIQMLEREKQLKEMMKEEYLFDSSDNDGRSTAEVIADIRKMLGITKDADTEEPSHEPN
jgi:hypothetical protein